MLKQFQDSLGVDGIGRDGSVAGYVQRLPGSIDCIGTDLMMKSVR